MITTDNRELYDICKSLRAHGWTRDLKNSKIFKRKMMNFTRIIDLFSQDTMLDHRNQWSNWNRANKKV